MCVVETGFIVDMRKRTAGASGRVQSELGHEVNMRGWGGDEPRSPEGEELKPVSCFY